MTTKHITIKYYRMRQKYITPVASRRNTAHAACHGGGKSSSVSALNPREREIILDNEAGLLAHSRWLAWAFPPVP